MRGKGRNNWLKVQPHHPAWVLLFRDTIALSRLMGVEVHQHQKCAFSWLRFKHKLQDAPCQPGFTLTNCETKDWSQEGGKQALLLRREQVQTEFLTCCVSIVSGRWPLGSNIQDIIAPGEPSSWRTKVVSL